MLILYQNIRDNVITIISIFLSLGIGMYIGYIIDLQSNVLETDEKLINFIERQISYLEYENMQLKNQILGQEKENLNIDCLLRTTLSNISLKKLINIQVTLISYDEEFSYKDFFTHLKEIGISNIDIITIKDSLTQEISKLIKSEKLIEDKEVFEVYIEKYLKDIFNKKITTESYSNKLKELSNNDYKSYNKNNFVILLKKSKSDKLSFAEEITEEVLIKICKQKNIPLIIIQKEMKNRNK